MTILDDGTIEKPCPICGKPMIIKVSTDGEIGVELMNSEEHVTCDDDNQGYLDVDDGQFS